MGIGISAISFVTIISSKTAAAAVGKNKKPGLYDRVF